MTDELNRLRLRFGHLLLMLMWAHVPLLMLVAHWTGTMRWTSAMAIGATLAMIYQVTWARHGVAPITRYISAVLLVAQPALLLLLLKGHPWQMDMHMYFFAMIALNIAWFDRNALLVAATATALHHLVLLNLLPLAVFSSEGDLMRVALHAVIVAFQTVVLIWVSNKIVNSFVYINRMSTELMANAVALEERSREAEEASRAKGMFLANMSHEIRTPINAILGFCHLVRRSELNPRQRSQIEKIGGAGATLLRLINDILDFSKGEAGQLTMEECVFDPREELSRLVQTLAEPVHDKNLSIVMRVDDSVPARLVGDVTRLNQILSNLLGNAIKFTGMGSVNISQRLLARQDDMVTLEIAISDSGIGMTEEQLSHMFTPFSQADASTTRRFGGTGLGLAICRQIAERMGGSIRAESTPGIGSIFTVELQLRVPDEQSRPQATPAPHVRDMQVLFVDDNPITRQIMRETFMRWDMTLDLAESGEAALARVARRLQDGTPYDLVMLDWKMPVMDGLETLRRMQASVGQAAMPMTLVITAHEIDELIRQAADLNIALFLAKPINPNSLAEALNQLPAARGQSQPLATQPELPALPPALLGRRVLLVEDNEINREIAAEILADAGLVVECAPDGVIACRMIEEQGADYAAVLMDIQMPEMDGITATRHIRKTWGSDRLPIIAMTAHAFEEERQRCLAAGMDDHLAKPFDPAHLIATLARWMRAAPAPRQPIDGLAVVLPDALPPFDIPAALRRMNGKPSLLRRMILTFAETNATFCDEIASLLDQGRSQDAHRLAHTLKGVAGALELARVAELAGALEQALTEQKRDRTDQLLAQLAPHIDHAVAAAGELLPPPVPTMAPDPFRAPDAPEGDLHESVQVLRDLIRRRSLSARQSFARLADALQLDDSARETHPLYQALQRLDYAGAAAIIDRDFPGDTERASA